ncbi:Uncharacterised protein [Staphylococcus pseudintermedius]|nr:Uncharacterised protein [Staphylococcus pseudintermedius]
MSRSLKRYLGSRCYSVQGMGLFFHGITEPMTLDLTPLNAKLEANAAI